MIPANFVEKKKKKLTMQLVTTDFGALYKYISTDTSATQKSIISLKAQFEFPIKSYNCGIYSKIWRSCKSPLSRRVLPEI